MRASAVSACVRLIAGNVAKLPIHVYRRTSGDTRRRLRESRIELLLNRRPNAWQTAFDFRRQMTASVALHGNAVAYKVTEGGAVTGLLPWPWESVRIEREDLFSAPTYELRDGGSVFRMGAGEVLHLRDLSLDGVVGLSRIQQAAQGIDLALNGESFANSFFVNGAEPGIALESERTLTAEQRKQLIESWRAAHQGPSRAHTPTVLEGGITLKPTTSTNTAAQLLELRSFQVEDIARIYGVPPHLIGLTEKQTSYGSGVESMALGFLQFHLLEWLVMWEAGIARDLIPAEDSTVEYAEHLVDGLLRADFETRMQGYAIGIQNGILSRNEARARENLAPYTGGDSFLYPSNMTDSSKADQVESNGDGNARMPGDRLRHEWRKLARAAFRAVAQDRSE